MHIKQPITYTLTTLLLTACNSLPTPDVTHYDLIRSMVYTQRHLLELELGTQPISQTNTHRHVLLLQSYCNLNQRDFAYAKTASAHCEAPANTETQLCMASFHRCISQCPTLKQHCEPCEQQATQCLNKATHSLKP